MRFLHTSDWHLGRTVRGRSRDSEHEAALQQVLDYAREQAVDCVIVAGDVYDTSAPPPEAERLLYDFLRELHGAGIPTVLIAGNHDHPRRFEAIAPLLRSVNVHAIGDPKPAGQGGDFVVRSRDGRETAVVAALPWVTERRAVEFAQLQAGPSAAILRYADQVAAALRDLSNAFRPDTVNILVAHALVDDAIVGAGGGERALHMTMGIYGIQRGQLPASAQYVALGHVHKAQELVKSPAAWYSGSLLQLDFGETEQGKYVNLAEVHPRQPAKVTQLPITAGRQLSDVGSPLRGVALADLPAVRERVGDAWLRVFVDLDMPVANLPAVVREQLPNAVHVERMRPGKPEEEAAPVQVSTPEEMFAAFYRSDLGHGREASAATLALFRRLLQEAEEESDEA